MKTSTITTTALSFAVIAALLTGCSATKGNTDLVPTSKPAASSAPDATDAPAPAEVKTGDVVDAASAEAVKAAGNGQRAYPMADGTFVIVTKTEPLPAAVQADAVAKQSAVVAAHRDISADMNGNSSALYAGAGRTAIETGKRVISVWALVGFPDMTYENKVPYWSVQGAGAPQQFTSRAEAESYVNGWLAQQSNANEFVAIYAD